MGPPEGLSYRRELRVSKLNQATHNDRPVIKMSNGRHRNLANRSMDNIETAARPNQAACLTRGKFRCALPSITILLAPIAHRYTDAQTKQPDDFCVDLGHSPLAFFRFFAKCLSSSLGVSRNARRLFEICRRSFFQKVADSIVQRCLAKIE